MNIEEAFVLAEAVVRGAEALANHCDECRRAAQDENNEDTETTLAQALLALRDLVTAAQEWRPWMTSGQESVSHANNPHGRLIRAIDALAARSK